MTAEKNKEKWQAYAAAHEQELYELVKTLARIPAPSGKEEKRAEFCLAWLKEHGAADAYTDDVGNVIFPYHVKNGYDLPSAKPQCESGAFSAAAESAQPLFIFDAHMDVVFSDETELSLTERDGRIYCPGVGDDTANLAVLLMMAAYAVENQIDTGEYGILFVCGVCEEGLGNLKGVREVCRVFGHRISAFFALDLGMDTYTCKAVGSIRYRIAVRTPGGHSYNCFGNANANAWLAKLITMLYEIEVPKRGKTTYNVGVIQGGTSVNTIAQYAEMLYEIRSDHAGDLAEMQQSFRQIMEEYKKCCPQGVSVSEEIIGERPCEQDVNQNVREKLFRLVEDTVRETAGLIPAGKSGSTDCNIPLSMGIPAVCAGTCIGAGAHTREEYIEKDSLQTGLQIGIKLLEKCIRVI